MKQGGFYLENMVLSFTPNYDLRRLGRNRLVFHLENTFLPSHQGTNGGAKKKRDGLSSRKYGSTIDKRRYKIRLEFAQ